MTDPVPGVSDPVDDRLALDPDVDVADSRNRDVAAPFDRVCASGWLNLRADTVAAVFVGGCVGGYTRYAITTAWTTPRNGFPWPIWAINTSGSFLLALIVIVATEVRPTRYLRPLLGTGFCGALTTFSAVVVTTAELLAHHERRTAIAYLAATIVAGLAAASFGLVTGRAVGQYRRRTHDPDRNS